MAIIYDNIDRLIDNELDGEIDNITSGDSNRYTNIKLHPGYEYTELGDYSTNIYFKLSDEECKIYLRDDDVIELSPSIDILISLTPIDMEYEVPNIYDDKSLGMNFTNKPIIIN